MALGLLAFEAAFISGTHDECHLTPVIHVLQHPGCKAQPIPSYACVGKCTSYVQVRFATNQNLYLLLAFALIWWSSLWFVVYFKMLKGWYIFHEPWIHFDVRFALEICMFKDFFSTCRFILFLPKNILFWCHSNNVNANVAINIQNLLLVYKAFARVLPSYLT